MWAGTGYTTRRVRGLWANGALWPMRSSMTGAERYPKPQRSFKCHRAGTLWFRSAVASLRCDLCEAGATAHWMLVRCPAIDGRCYSPYPPTAGECPVRRHDSCKRTGTDHFDARSSRRDVCPCFGARDEELHRSVCRIQRVIPIMCDLRRNSNLTIALVCGHGCGSLPSDNVRQLPGSRKSASKK